MKVSSEFLGIHITDNVITSTLLSRQNKRNLCYGLILVTGVLRNFYCNFKKEIILLNKIIKFCILPFKMLYVKQFTDTSKYQ